MNTNRTNENKNDARRIARHALDSIKAIREDHRYPNTLRGAVSQNRDGNSRGSSTRCGSEIIVRALLVLHGLNAQERDFDAFGCVHALAADLADRPLPAFHSEKTWRFFVELGDDLRNASDVIIEQREKIAKLKSDIAELRRDNN